MVFLWSPEVQFGFWLRLLTYNSDCASYHTRVVLAIVPCLPLNSSCTPISLGLHSRLTQNFSLELYLLPLNNWRVEGTWPPWPCRPLDCTKISPSIWLHRNCACGCRLGACIDFMQRPFQLLLAFFFSGYRGKEFGASDYWLVSCFQFY